PKGMKIALYKLQPKSPSKGPIDIVRTTVAVPMACITSQSGRVVSRPLTSQCFDCKHRVHVVCLNSARQGPTQQREEQRSRTISQSLASELQMPAPTGPGMSPWMSVLDMFIISKDKRRSSLEEISDFNTWEDDDDNDAVYMYTSHLADRLAMDPVERDTS
ncbi:hypothetical protein Agub_g5351, partial [Astrephomene gubernaculifera]